MTQQQAVRNAQRFLVPVSDRRGHSCLLLKRLSKRRGSKFLMWEEIADRLCPTRMRPLAKRWEGR